MGKARGVYPAITMGMSRGVDMAIIIGMNSGVKIGSIMGMRIVVYIATIMHTVRGNSYYNGHVQRGLKTSIMGMDTGDF
jgi:hypothetical protein